MTIEEFKKAEILLRDLYRIDSRLAHMRNGAELKIAFIFGGDIDDYPINREDVLQFLQSRKESIEKELDAL